VFATSTAEAPAFWALPSLRERTGTARDERDLAGQAAGESRAGGAERSARGQDDSQRTVRSLLTTANSPLAAPKVLADTETGAPTKRDCGRAGNQCPGGHPGDSTVEVAGSGVAGGTATPYGLIEIVQPQREQS